MAAGYDGICDSRANATKRQVQLVGEAGGQAFGYRKGTELDLQQTVGAPRDGGC